MTDKTQIEVRLSNIAKERLDIAIANYEQRVLARARSIATDENIDVSHIRAAEAELRPSTAKTSALLLD